MQRFCNWGFRELAVLLFRSCLVSSLPQLAVSHTLWLTLHPLPHLKGSSSSLRQQILCQGGDGTELCYTECPEAAKKSQMYNSSIMYGPTDPKHVAQWKLPVLSALSITLSCSFSSVCLFVFLVFIFFFFKHQSIMCSRVSDVMMFLFSTDQSVCKDGSWRRIQLHLQFFLL